MNAIDLFAGAGGLSEGFRKAKFNILAHVEMDESACYTLKTREAFIYLSKNGKIDRYYDYVLGKITKDELYSLIPNKRLKKVIQSEISNTTIDEIFHKLDKLVAKKTIDLIIGGPPCQAYSLAGRSRDPEGMKNDPRNYLYKQYIKFLVKYNPKMFVFENVTGILSAQNGEIFKNMTKHMNDAGYNIDFKVLNSKDFGVLQSRKRVVIIGWKKNIDFTYFDFTKKYSEYTIKDLFIDLPAIKNGEVYDATLGYLKNDSNLLSKKLRIRSKNWPILLQHISRPNRDLDKKIYHYYVGKYNSSGIKPKYNELPKEFITHNNTKSFLDRFNIVPYDSISHTIVAHISKDGHYYIHPDINQNRSISVREAARIQSFPDDYYFETSRTAAFKQIGNAVPPMMAQKIGREIYNFLKDIKI